MEIAGKLDSSVCEIKIHFTLNSQGNEKFQLFCQGKYDFQNLESEISFIVDYKYVRKSAFDWLAAELWLKESTILWKGCTFELNGFE